MLTATSRAIEKLQAQADAAESEQVLRVFVKRFG